jgi:hypothetical protein
MTCNYDPFHNTEAFKQQRREERQRQIDKFEQAAREGSDSCFFCGTTLDEHTRSTRYGNVCTCNWYGESCERMADQECDRSVIPLCGHARER